MTFSIAHVGRRTGPLAGYRYAVYEDSRLVAWYWHDLRGDEHGIDFVGGASVSSPLGRVTDFIEGGGPLPLALSVQAQVFLGKKLHGQGGS